VAWDLPACRVKWEIEALTARKPVNKSLVGSV